MRRASNKSIRVSNRRNTEMEEEKQHEAAGQPGTEVLAEERTSPAVSVASPAGEETAPAQAEIAPLPEDETSEPVLAGQTEAATPQSEVALASVSEDEIAEDVLSEEAGSAEPDDELLEDSTQPDSGGSDSVGDFDLQADQGETCLLSQSADTGWQRCVAQLAG